MWLIVVAAVVLIGLLAVVFLLSQQQPPAPASAIAPAVPAQQDIPYPAVARVLPGDAHGSANAGAAVIVDVRGREFFDQSHAAGAISMPLDEIPARIGELPKDRQILTYCT